MNVKSFRKSIRYRIVAFLLMLVMLTNSCITPVFAVTIEEPPVTGEIIDSEVPTETEAPAETEAPTDSEVPAETEAPTDPEVPAETEAPTDPEVPVETEAPTEPEPAAPAGGDNPEDFPKSAGLPAVPLNLKSFGIYQPALMTMNDDTPTYLNPQTLVVSTDNENNDHTGSADEDLHNYLFAEESVAPIEVRFDIETMPARNAYIAIHAWDCDETSTNLPEYDAVYVNGVKVGVMTGQNQEWNTTLLAVPVSALHEGANYVTIHIGAKDLATGEIYEYYANRWAIEVKWVQLLLDGGANESKPEEFYLTLQNAYAVDHTVYCEAAVRISSSTIRNYSLEYNLVDRSSPASPSYLQIVSTDSEYVSGEYIETFGLLSLSLDAMSGEYSVQVLLKDPDTGEILAVDEAYFDFESGKVPSFDVTAFTVSLDPIEYTSGPVTMSLYAQLKNVEALSGITFAVNGEPVEAVVDANGVVTGTYVVNENGLYRVEVLYTKDGETHGAKQYVTVDNIVKVLEAFNVYLDPTEDTLGPVTLNLYAKLQTLLNLSDITFAVNGETVATAVDAEGVATGTYAVTKNGEYRVEIRYVQDGEQHSAEKTVTVDNIIEDEIFFEYSLNGGAFKKGKSVSIYDMDTISVKAYIHNPDGTVTPVSSDGNPYTYHVFGNVYKSTLSDDTISLLFHRGTQAGVSVLDQDDNVIATFNIDVDGAEYSLQYILNDEAASGDPYVAMINQVDTLKLFAFASYDDGSLYLIDNEGDGYTFEADNNLLTVSAGSYMNVAPSGRNNGDSGVTLKKYGYYMDSVDIEILSLDDGKDILLGDIKDGDIPADDERMMDLVEEYLEDAGLSQSRAEEVVQAVENASYPYDQLYLYSLFEYNIASTSNPNGSFFSPATDGLNLGANTSPSAFLNTWFHESGHALDWSTGNNSYRTITVTTYDLLENDLRPDIEAQIQTELDALLRNKVSPGSVSFTEAEINRIVNNIMGADNAPYANVLGLPKDPDPDNMSGDLLTIYKRTRKSISKDLATIAYSNAEMGADVNGGLCNNTIRGNMGHNYPFGDGTTYWFDNGVRTGLQCAEAWAEFFSAKMIGDTAAQNRNATYFPETCAYFEVLAIEMLEELKAGY